MRGDAPDDESGEVAPQKPSEVISGMICALSADTWLTMYCF